MTEATVPRQLDVLECILCRHPLSVPGAPSRQFFPEDGTIPCRGCGHVFPIRWGIPDLRSPTYREDSSHLFDRDQDLAFARMLAERFTTASFMGLLDYFNQRSKEVLLNGRLTRSGAHTLDVLRKTFTSRIRRAIDDPWPRSGRRIFDQANALGIRTPLQARRAADLGCGSGIQLLGLAPDAQLVYGVDISLKNLLLSKKLLEEHGIDNVCLIAADARRLPFAHGTMDLVTLVDILEHIEEPSKLLQECSRVITETGMVYLATPNRFSLWREPHSGLWGLGFFPRHIAPRYVWLRKQLPFKVHLYSRGELLSLVRPHFVPFMVSSFTYLQPQNRAVKWVAQRLDTLMKISALRSPVERVIPVHELICCKRVM